MKIYILTMLVLLVSCQFQDEIPVTQVMRNTTNMDFVITDRYEVKIIGHGSDYGYKNTCEKITVQIQDNQDGTFSEYDFDLSRYDLTERVKNIKISEKSINDSSVSIEGVLNWDKNYKGSSGVSTSGNIVGTISSSSRIYGELNIIKRQANEKIKVQYELLY